MKTKEDFFFTKTVQDETSCASTCNANTHCHSALFDRISKKCSLLRAKEHFQSQDTVEPREKILLEKVAIVANNKHESSDNSAANEGNGNTTAVRGQNVNVWKSCHDILQRNSSSPSERYNITLGNITWETRCSMRGIPGCGNGTWELLMRIKDIIPLTGPAKLPMDQ
ncbi:hypothetical protein pdam_00012721 [Pocillopora damicornis]|uniref:Apple domain-containing protein n=1 Tax=Pocillopora damicornis TaxID=46731 RepID=A0A3M6TTJ5_POCDA|nr:hypothetical protein pdam_00012721 [Pocillopora damicornis]